MYFLNDPIDPIEMELCNPFPCRIPGEASQIAPSRFVKCMTGSGECDEESRIDISGRSLVPVLGGTKLIAGIYA